MEPAAMPGPVSQALKAATIARRKKKVIGPIQCSRSAHLTDIRFNNNVTKSRKRNLPGIRRKATGICGGERWTAG
jgi:hypothetical protein